MKAPWIAPLAALLLAPALACAGEAAAGEVSAGRVAAADGAAGDVAAGEQLFTARCALCHVGFAPGTIMLGRRLGKERALLAERTDLAADYVRQVVRHGLLSMPPFTRVDLDDGELAQVIAFLTRTRTPATPAAAP